MHRLMRATIVILLIGTLFLYPLLAPPPHRIDEAHFQLITEGVTEAEVEAIFGVPAGSYDWARPKFNYYHVAAALVAARHRVQADLRRAAKQEVVRLAERPSVHDTKNWVSRRAALARWKAHQSSSGK